MLQVVIFFSFMTVTNLPDPAIDRYRAPNYIKWADLERRITSDGYRFDANSKAKIPLFLDLRNSLFADSMESGVGFLQ